MASPASKAKRKSYTKEYMQGVINYCRNVEKQLGYENGAVYKAVNHFQLHYSIVYWWMQNEAKIEAAPANTRRMGSGRKAEFSVFEKKLYNLFQKRISKGKKHPENGSRAKDANCFAVCSPTKPSNFRMDGSMISSVAGIYRVAVHRKLGQNLLEIKKFKSARFISTFEDFWFKMDFSPRMK